MKVWRTGPLFKVLAIKVARIYGQSALKKWLFWVKQRSLHWAIYLAFVFLVVGGVLGVQSYRQGFCQAVLLDGREIGLVAKTEDIDCFVSSLSENCSKLYGVPVTPLEKVTYSREYRPGDKVNSQSVRETLRQEITMVTEAVMVTIDDQPVVAVKNSLEVESLVDLLGQHYTGSGDGLRLLEVKLVETLAGRECRVKPEEIYTASLVANLLTGGDEGRVINTLSRGDTPFHGAEVLPEDGLPDLHVITIEEISRTEAIPCSTNYVYDDNMWNVQAKTVVPGKPGCKKVVYIIDRENGREICRQKISETVLEEPVTEVIKRGTSRVPAYGTGQFIWPIPQNVDRGGRITQGFRGYAHRGIDISSTAGTSTPIIAADSGVVVSIGNRGSLGNYIIIYHGNYYTVYMHNSRNLVASGTVVNKGQTIAYMGSTGRSTGVHLHFEIRRSDGSGQWTSWDSNPPLDPLNFFHP